MLITNQTFQQSTRNSNNCLLTKFVEAFLHMQFLMDLNIVTQPRNVRFDQRLTQQGKKITHEFRVCCLHDDVEDTPYMFWSCGKTVSRYDPIANTSKRCKPLKLRHCNFTIYVKLINVLNILAFVASAYDVTTSVICHHCKVTMSKLKWLY
jgi:hypothetical protein